MYCPICGSQKIYQETKNKEWKCGDCFEYIEPVQNKKIEQEFEDKLYSK
jgi:transcription initiation factor TFIIIB Brf1 subunit/transcription initiation factor TFIIB